jgi:hypothetical protein
MSAGCGDVVWIWDAQRIERIGRRERLPKKHGIHLVLLDIISIIGKKNVEYPFISIIGLKRKSVFLEMVSEKTTSETVINTNHLAG